MNWKFFLEDVSKTLLQSEDLLDEFSSLSLEWLGFDGVSEEAI